MEEQENQMNNDDLIEAALAALDQPLPTTTEPEPMSGGANRKGRENHNRSCRTGAIIHPVQRWPEWTSPPPDRKNPSAKTVLMRYGSHRQPEVSAIAESCS